MFQQRIVKVFNFLSRSNLFIKLTPARKESERTIRFASLRFGGYDRQTIRMLGIASCLAVGAAAVNKTFDFLGIRHPIAQNVYALTNDDQENKINLRNRWNFIADVVEKTAPAVVYIEIQGRHPFSNKMVAVSNGSGFIVRSDGLILTNAHVVGNNRTVRVKLHDGRTLTGEVQAVDPVSDLATVRIDAQNLPTLRLGNSSNLRTGEWVVALGSPFQLSNTVTAGIISSVQRRSKELGLHGRDMDYIQTDANINFGNSGGPLVSLDGEAIGINTMKVTAGISFAIPSDYAKKFLEKAEKVEKRVSGKQRSWFGGSSARRFVGITMLSLTPNLIADMKSRQYDFPEIDHGVLVYQVVAGSPAHRAGIQPGDVITQLNDSDVMSASDIYSAIKGTDNLRITIHRGSTSFCVEVAPEAVE